MDEKNLIQQQLDLGSHMVTMIFKFYLQSGELDFFIRRLRNLVTTAPAPQRPSSYQVTDR